MKKGMTLQSGIVWIVLFGIVVICLFLFYDKLFGVVDTKARESECQASLLLTQRVDEYQPWCVSEVQNPIPLKCARNFVTVDKEVTKNGESADYDDACPDGSNSCLAKNALAEEMRSCWKLFFEGSQMVFQQMEVDEYKVFMERDYKQICYICSEITLKTAAGNLTEYMMEKEFRDEQTYYDYLTHKSAICDENLIDKSAYLGLVSSPHATCWDAVASGYEMDASARVLYSRPNIRPDNVVPGKYAVVFARRGMGSCQAEEEGAILHRFVTNTVQIVPVDKLTQVCDGVIM